jgi:hypothetical protein
VPKKKPRHCRLVAKTGSYSIALRRPRIIYVQPALPYDLTAERRAARQRQHRWRGGTPGRRQALARVIQPWLRRQSDLNVDEVFNKLEEIHRRHSDHPVVNDVLRRRSDKLCRTLGCKDEYHIHWTSDAGTRRTTGFRALRNLLTGLKKAPPIR